MFMFTFVCVSMIVNMSVLDLGGYNVYVLEGLVVIHSACSEGVLNL